MRTVSTMLALAALAGPAMAQPRPGRAQDRPPVTAPAPTPPAAPTRSEPSRTTATFDDWTLRCVRPEGAPPLCEVTTVTSEGNQAVAQTAVGRPAKGEPVRLTVQVGTNVTVETPPRVQEPDGTLVFELGWRRCLPGGCFANAPLTDDQVAKLRARSEPLRVQYQDALGRPVTVAVSLRGLGPALDALAKETGG